ncbi:MAG TPA: hypothetical protein VIG62_15470 [Blastocatellia bacterium]|jgi:hypothetical protein
MKNDEASLLVFITMIVVLFFLDVPFWAFILVIWPVLIIVLSYTSFRYSFRSSLKIEAIPTNKFQNRVSELEKAEAEIFQLGFHRIDRFYLEMSNDVITFVYKHADEPAYLCLYHFGKKQVCDIITFFDDDLSLTTCSDIGGGMTPRPANRLLQILEQASYSQLFDLHISGVEFLKRRGAVTVDVPVLSFRDSFMTSLKEFAGAARSTFLWPVKHIYWTATSRGRKHAGSIQEQHDRGRLKNFKFEI